MYCLMLHLFNQKYSKTRMLLNITQLKLFSILFYLFLVIYMKSSDAKASKCHLKFSSLMMIFIKHIYLSSVISLK